MKYNFIRQGEEYPFLSIIGDINTFVKGNHIKLEDKVYEIKLIENELVRDENVYSYAELEKVNIYIKEKVNFNYM